MGEHECTVILTSRRTILGRFCIPAVPSILSSRDILIEDVPCRNLEEVLGGFGRSFQILAERTVTNAYTPENPLIVNTGILTGSNVMTGLRAYFSAYSPLKASNKGLPGRYVVGGKRHVRSQAEMDGTR